MPLAQAPALAYPELVRSGALEKLIGLLSHENVDIAIDVIEVLHELTDEDVGEAVDDDEEEEDDEEGGTRSERALKELINALVRVAKYPLTSLLMPSPGPPIRPRTPCRQHEAPERGRRV